MELRDKDVQRLKELLEIIGAPVKEDRDVDWSPEWGILDNRGFALLRDDTYLMDEARQALVELINLIHAAVE